MAIGNLPSVKYQILLGKLMDTVFVDNFTKVLKNLEKLQNVAAPDKKKENLIVTECGIDVIHFTHPMFEQRQPPVPGEFDLHSSPEFLLT